MKHLSVDDDLVLMSPSMKVLQKLLNVCSKYAGDFDIVNNQVKTKYLVFRPCAVSLLNALSSALGEIAL